MTVQYSPNQMAIIGKRLKDYRHVRGFSQTEVARAIGLPNGSSLSMAESGNSHSKLVLLLPDLCRFYGVELNVFTGNLPPGAPAPARTVITARDVMVKLDLVDQRMERLEVKLDRILELLEADSD